MPADALSPEHRLIVEQVAKAATALPVEGDRVVFLPSELAAATPGAD